MVGKGLVEEIKGLYAMGLNRKDTSMQGIRYKEIIAYLEGEYSLEEAIYIIKRETRHFAKRQLTWFRREKDVTMIMKQDFPDESAILDFMMSQIYDKQIIQKAEVENE